MWDTIGGKQKREKSKEHRWVWQMGVADGCGMCGIPLEEGGIKGAQVGVVGGCGLCENTIFF